MTNEVKQLGRPVNSESKRQQILQERELKKQNGMFKLGRPVKEDSERQKRLKELLRYNKRNGVFIWTCWLGKTCKATTLAVLSSSGTQIRCVVNAVMVNMHLFEGDLA